MTLGTSHGRVASTPGQFNSGWFLIDRYSVSATTQVNFKWTEYMPELSAVTIQCKNWQTSTIYLPNILFGLATDSAATFNQGNWFYQTSYVPQGLAATAEQFRNIGGLPGAFQFILGTATSAICGATGGTSFPDAWNITIEVPNVQGGGGCVPVRFRMDWPSTTTNGLYSGQGRGMFMANTQAFGVQMDLLALQSGIVEIWGLRSKSQGLPF